ncbi:MAG: hypothetical protein JXA82_18680 [Sedimentisphaerales bacterium]|nr:hypothetical protein [Sedimentisphaerales bacterium]
MKRFVSYIVLLAAVLLFGWILFANANSDPNTSIPDDNKSDTKTAPSPSPRIYWFWMPSYDPAELVPVCDSGVITDVIITTPNPYDTWYWRAQYQEVYGGKRYTIYIPVAERIEAAIRLCKQAGLGVVICPRLWPSSGDYLTPAHMYDPDYYSSVITWARNRWPGYPVALNTEPNSDTVAGKMIKGKEPLDLSRLTAAVNSTIRKVGKVDLIFPAGSSNPDSAYMPLALLGRARITEGTYYGMAPEKIKYPFEMVGYFISTEDRTGSRIKPLRVEQVFADRWIEITKYGGCMIYITRTEALEVAKAIQAWKKSQTGKTK